MSESVIYTTPTGMPDNNNPNSQMSQTEVLTKLLSIVRSVVNFNSGVVNVSDSGGGGTGSVNLVEVGGTSIVLGQSLSATSIPVVLASNQSAIPVKIEDSAGNSLTSTSNALNVNIVGSGAPGQVQYTGSPSESATTVISNLQSGYDYTNSVVRPLATSNSGILMVAQGNLTAALDTVSIGNGSNLLAINGSGQIAISNFPATQAVTQSGSWSVTANAGTNLNTSALALESGGNLATLAGTVSSSKINVNLSSSGITLPVSATSLPLPTGAATSALQTTGNTSLATIATNIPPQGQALAAASMPVVLPTSQITALTPPTTVTVTQATGTNLHTVVDSATIASIPVDNKPATINISAVDSSSSVATGANGQSIITGTPSANSTASFAIANFDTIRVLTSGTWVGTLQSELSWDGGTTWFTTGLHQSGTSYISSSFTANFGGLLNVGGLTNYRIRATAWTSGTATILVNESANASSVYIANTLKLSDATTPSQQAAISSVGALSSNLTQIAGNSVSTAASGIPKVGLTDGSGTAINSTSNALNVSVTNPTIAVTESGTWTVQPGNTPNSTPWLTTNTPATSGGWSASLTASLSTTVTSVKSSAGQVGGWFIYNPNTSAAYVQIFNIASGSVTLGTSTPILSLGIPPGAGANVEFMNGIAFSTAISVAATTTATGSTAPSVALTANIIYK